jgi:antitoxin (DNA-binding transcriptional repressor) of toxin-antitoxin stability system
MNRRVSGAEANNKLSSIIHEVEKNSIVEITRYGRTVAFGVPQKEYVRLQEKGRGYWESFCKVRNVTQAEGIGVEEGDFPDRGRMESSKLFANMSTGSRNRRPKG